jgi:hypothetical protein
VCEGKQTGWGGSVAKMTRAQIYAFIADLYDGNPVYASDSAVPHLIPQLEALRAYVARLDPDTLHAVVAAEL